MVDRVGDRRLRSPPMIRIHRSSAEPVTVEYSVAVNAPGGGTPTGHVTVSDGVAIVHGPGVAAGSCDITLQ